MKLTEEKITENWNTLMRIINETFSGAKKDAIVKLHEHYSERMALAPASAKEHFHNAFPGGYVEHVLHVIANAKKLLVIWKEAGASINFTEEELVCAALFHDLGKVGSLTTDYYIPNESDWHRKNQGKIYELNPELQYMQVTDRSFLTLSQFNVPITENECLGIRLADGMYAEHNKGYLASYDENFRLKTNLPHIIHQADMLAAMSEYDAWKNSGETVRSESDPKKDKLVKREKILTEAFQKGGTAFDPKMFDDLFK